MRAYFGNNEQLFTEKRALFLKLPDIRSKMVYHHEKIKLLKTDKARKSHADKVLKLEKERSSIFEKIDKWEAEE